MLILTPTAVAAIHTLDQARTDGGLGVTYDGTHYLCRDVRSDPTYAEYATALVDATVYRAPVSKRQARLALLAAGLLSQVDAAIAAITDTTERQAAEIDWQYADVIERDHPLLLALASGLGLSEGDLDNLFAQAALI